MTLPDKTNEQLDLATQLFINAATLSRTMLAGRLGTQFGGKRDLYETFGYPLVPTYQDYRNLYDRQGIAARAVEKFADDTWNKAPIIIDGDAKSSTLDEKKATPFLQEWSDLADRLQVYQIFRQADIMLGFGKYSVIFLGAPGESFIEPAKNNGLFYISAFDESQAQIDTLIQDTKSEKFGMPARYTIQFASVDTGLEVRGGSSVDNSRVIHISENRLGSRIYGRPRLQILLNRLFDLEKVTGGGAEAAWLTVYKGMLLTAKDGAELPAKGSPAANYLDEQINSFINRMQRYAVLTDVDVHDMGVGQVSIKDLYDTIISDIAGTLGIPQRILLGSERGNQASTQDTEEWNGVIRSRRTNFAEPEILRPFINWCVAHKVISPPKSGKFRVEWEPVYPMSQAEEADYAQKIAQGASTVTGGMPEEALEVNEWRSIIHLPPRTPEDLDAARERQKEEQPTGGENNPLFDETTPLAPPKGKGFSQNEMVLSSALARLLSTKADPVLEIKAGIEAHGAIQNEKIAELNTTITALNQRIQELEQGTKNQGAETRTWLERLITLSAQPKEPPNISVNVENHPGKKPKVKVINDTQNKIEVPPSSVTVQVQPTPIQNLISVLPAPLQSIVKNFVSPTPIENKIEVQPTPIENNIEVNTPKLRKSQDTVQRDSSDNITGKTTKYEYEE